MPPRAAAKEIGSLSPALGTEASAQNLRAKASKLVDIARGCALQRVAACQNTEGGNPPATGSLGACNARQGPNGAVSLPSGEPVTFSTDAASCSAIAVDTQARLGTTTYTAHCGGSWNTGINCTLTP